MTSTVNDKTVTYQYYPSGLTKSSTPEGGQSVTMVYNLQGKRIKLIEPDGGFVRTEYNGFGELTKEVQRVHLNQTDSIITLNNYDNFGRLLTINRNLEETTYTYDPDIKSRVNIVELKDKNSQVQNRQTFTYDPTKITDRITNVQEEIADNTGNLRTYNTGKVYDGFGRVIREIYPSGYYTENTYDNYSNMTEVRDEAGSGHSIWKANTENALGQATSIFKGTKETNYGYNPINHQTTGIYADGVINYSYGYYAADGMNHANNLQWRTDNRTTQREDFTYDTQNRLTNWNVTRGGQTTYNSMSFDGNSNITQKTDLGAFTLSYGGQRVDGSPIGPHALATISGVPISPFPQTDLTVSYTDFKKIKILDEGTKHYELSYGVDDQRRMSIYKESGVTKLTRYYVGDYEEEVMANGNIRKIHYLSGAILIQNSNSSTDSLLYTYSDAQGSLIALTDANGGIVRKYAYDPWGARRKYDNWNVKDDCVGLVINRGYTGHEHLDAFGIINMNGRVYDPFTAQFFSPDPYVQAPGDWLNYNRYTYCLNNPFRYTDPSGNNFFYVMPSFSYSYYGGLQVNVCAGIGVPGAASYGISLGYNFKHGNWSATANASLGNFYGYAGYDSKAGFIAGVGFGFNSPIYGISSNLLGASINYSAKGGFNLSMFGFNMGNNGVSFDPSVGASYRYEFENPTLVYSSGNNAQTTNKDGSTTSQNSTNNDGRKIHRLFLSSQAAYRYMIRNSKEHEVAAVNTIDGQVLVFDATGNSRTTSQNYFIGESSNVNINGRVVRTTGEVHTHPGNLNYSTNNPEHLYNPLGISDADWKVAHFYGDNISIIMAGNLYSNIYLPNYWNNKYYNLQGCEIK